MQYSPKLKKAMEEIKKVLTKYDIAGTVVIHTPGHSEYLKHLTPSYSAVIINGDEWMVRARAKEDFNGDKKARDKKIADTANMLHLLSTTGANELMGIIKLSEMADKLVNADHFGGGHSSNTEQNN